MHPLQLLCTEVKSVLEPLALTPAIVASAGQPAAAGARRMLPGESHRTVSASSTHPHLFGPAEGACSPLSHHSSGMPCARLLWLRMGQLAIDHPGSCTCTLAGARFISTQLARHIPTDERDCEGRNEAAALCASCQLQSEPAGVFPLLQRGQHVGIARAMWPSSPLPRLLMAHSTSAGPMGALAGATTGRWLTRRPRPLVCEIRPGGVNVGVTALRDSKKYLPDLKGS